MITYENYLFAAGPALQNCSAPFSKSGRCETRPSKAIIQWEPLPLHGSAYLLRFIRLFFAAQLREMALKT
jgi:hypothetical protein